MGFLLPIADQSGFFFFIKRRFWLLLCVAVLLRLALGVGLYTGAALVSKAPPLEAVSSRLLVQDAITYHDEAVNIIHYWRNRAPGDYSWGRTPSSYSFILAAAYLIWAHPLMAVLLNALCFAGVGVLAYFLALQLGQPSYRASWLALLVCLWPPSLVYTSVPLRYGLWTLGVFLALTCLSFLWSRERRAILPSLFGMLGLGGGFWLLLILRGQFRLLVLGFALLAVVLFIVVRSLRNRNWILAATVLAITGAVCLTVVVCSQPLELVLRYRPQAQGQPGDHRPRLVRILGKPADRIAFLRDRYIYWGGRSISPEARLVREWMGFDLTGINRPEQNQWDRRAMKFINESGRLGPWQLIKGWGIMGLAALRDLFLFPFPWQSWPASSPESTMRLLVLAQTLLGYLLLPGIWAGLLGRRWRTGPQSVLLAWVGGLGIVLGLVVVNLGTLYRLRDMIWLPALLAFDPRPYVWLGKKLLKRDFRL
jgi:hypothetical protein